MFQEDFGARLRELRLAKGLTKEDFCNGDELLCVRQLTRLETGKSQPKLETLTLLAQRLGMTVSELIGETETKTELPAEYLKLKYQLLHTPTYDNLDILRELDNKISKILENYYDDLPKEEQLIVDIVQSKIYSYQSSDNQKYGMSILEEHLESLCQERVYSVKDLLVIQLYQMSLGSDDDIKSSAFDVAVFHDISRNLLQSMKNIPNDYLFLLRDALMTIPAVEHDRKDFRYTKEALKQLKYIMEETQDFQKKSIVYLMEAQYVYFYEHNSEKAEELYDQAILLSRLLGNEFLAQKIEEEKKQDMLFS